jgi:hypothetical protein
MRARLVSGEVVELVNTEACGCAGRYAHTEPHWLRANDQWKARNREMLEGWPPNPAGYLVEERARLKDKWHHMISAGIVEIIRDEPREGQGGKPNDQLPQSR